MMIAIRIGIGTEGTVGETKGTGEMTVRNPPRTRRTYLPDLAQTVTRRRRQAHLQSEMMRRLLCRRHPQYQMSMIL